MHLHVAQTGLLVAQHVAQASSGVTQDIVECSGGVAEEGVARVQEGTAVAEEEVAHGGAGKLVGGEHQGRAVREDGAS